MPRADPLVKKGVLNRREKITIDGLTATRGHHQNLRRQLMNKKFRDKAKTKRETAERTAAQKTSGSGNGFQHTQSTGNNNGLAKHAEAGIYYDYKRGIMAALKDKGDQAALASAAATFPGAHYKTEQRELKGEVKVTDNRDMASAVNGLRQ